MPNPFAAGGALGDVLLAAKPFLEAATGLPLVLVCIAALILRFARSSGAERLQLKWFFYAAGLSFALIFASFTGPKGLFANLAFASGMVAMGLVPIAAGIAILRYRLYDIDLLIKRTLVYGATSAAIGATFFAGIVGLQAVISPLTSGSELAVAASTLVSFALFQPIRRRVQSAVDRRFDRSRYDAARTVDAFALRLRDQVDLDALRRELVAVARDTMQPAHASVWLRERI